jgi:hypothetical protein
LDEHLSHSADVLRMLLRAGRPCECVISSSRGFHSRPLQQIADAAFVFLDALGDGDPFRVVLSRPFTKSVKGWGSRHGGSEWSWGMIVMLDRDLDVA